MYLWQEVDGLCRRVAVQFESVMEAGVDDSVVPASAEVVVEFLHDRRGGVLRQE